MRRDKYNINCVIILVTCHCVTLLTDTFSANQRPHHVPSDQWEASITWHINYDDCDQTAAYQHNNYSLWVIQTVCCLSCDMMSQSHIIPTNIFLVEQRNTLFNFLHIFFIRCEWVCWDYDVWPVDMRGALILIAFSLWWGKILSSHWSNDQDPGLWLAEADVMREWEVSSCSSLVDS